MAWPALTPLKGRLVLQHVADSLHLQVTVHVCTLDNRWRRAATKWNKTFCVALTKSHQQHSGARANLLRSCDQVMHCTYPAVQHVAVLVQHVAVLGYHSGAAVLAFQLAFETWQCSAE